MQTIVYSVQRVLEPFEMLPKPLLACNSVKRLQDGFRGSKKIRIAFANLPRNLYQA